MNTVSYEASTKAQLISLIIPAAAIVFAVVLASIMPMLIRKTYEKRGVNVNMKFVRGFCAFFFIFLLFWCILAFGGQWDMHNKVIGAYQRGEYQTVEGYVENFDPMPYEGRKDECFEVNGVKFFYSTSAIQPGYHQTQANGGVITGDGQHLKISYVYLDEVYGNVIVYIEEIAE